MDSSPFTEHHFNPKGFDSYPYLVTHLDHHRIHLRLLPQGTPDNRLLDLAQHQSLVSNRRVKLALTEDNITCFEKGQQTPQAMSPLPASRLIWLGHLENEKKLTQTANLCLRWRYFHAWHSWERGYSPLFTRKITKENLEHPPTRPSEMKVCQTTCFQCLNTTEITQFFTLAHRVAAKNPLFKLPEDGNQMIATLSWYNTLQSAWIGGWLKKQWRAWMVETAIAAHLFPKEISKAVFAVHSTEGAKPGARPEFFGQALAREFPNLFAHLNTTRLEQQTRENMISFVA